MFALMAFSVLSIMGIGSYWYLSRLDIIPQEYLDQFYLYMGITSIPFLIWMCFNKSDEEWNKIIEKEKQEKIINDEIRAKYDAMPDLESKHG